LRQRFPEQKIGVVSLKAIFMAGIFTYDPNNDMIPFINPPHFDKGTIMAIGVLATITVQEGKNEEFERIFLELTEQVRANESGNVFYALHRSKSDPQFYKVMEQYVGPAALAEHGQSDYFRQANEKLAGLVAAAPDIELLDAV